MKAKTMLGVVLLALGAAAALSGCGKAEHASKKEHASTKAHEAVTFMAPYMDTDRFIEAVHAKYPEVNIEIIPYSGDNTTTYLQNMMAAGDLPDVCTMTVYDPYVDDFSAQLLDLSGYEFTDRYVESRLRDVADEGAIYMLPSAYSCFGIIYNKRLLAEHGWTRPNSFEELEELAVKAKEAGVQLCEAQVQYPGYGFQYLCNIADAGFLGTLDERQWQKDYLSGSADVRLNEGMMKSMAYIQKWKDLGMLTLAPIEDATDDQAVRDHFLEGNTLFLLGAQNGIVDVEGNEESYGLMPYLSENGDQNVYILSVNRYYGLNKKLEETPEKLEDALKVMDVLSTVEGTQALYTEDQLKVKLLPFKDAEADETFYGEIADEINAGSTAPFIYSGWENTIVTTGNRMLDFIKDEAGIEDVIDQLENDQALVVNQQPEIYTTTTETISQENCARLVGKCFMEATDSAAALISLGTWIPGNGSNQNQQGVSGKLYAKEISDYDICTILPTSWSGTIKTVRLSGKEIRALAEEGCDILGNGTHYPYVLSTAQELQDETEYQVVLCGASEALKAAHEITDSGVVGMDAAKAYLRRFETLSEKDLA